MKTLPLSTLQLNKIREHYRGQSFVALQSLNWNTDNAFKTTGQKYGDDQGNTEENKQNLLRILHPLTKISVSRSWSTFQILNYQISVLLLIIKLTFNQNL